MGGTPREIWEDREYWGEANAMIYLRDRFTEENLRCPLFSRIRRSVDLCQELRNSIPAKQRNQHHPKSLRLAIRKLFADALVCSQFSQQLRIEAFTADAPGAILRKPRCGSLR